MWYTIGEGCVCLERVTMNRKRQLIFWIGLLLTIGFLITSMASYIVSRASLRKQITQGHLPLTSDNIYSKIQNDLIVPILISSHMAGNTFLRDWVLEGEKDVDEMTRYLKEIQIKYGVFTSFFVSERTRIYYQSEGILKKVDPEAERDVWYFRVRNMEPLYEINIDLDMANQDALTIFINYKVFDYQQNFIGAAGVGLTVNSVRRLIDEYQQTFNRRVYFIDRSGKITLHGSSIEFAVENIRDMEGLAALADRILAGKESQYQYERDGTTVHLNTRYIPEFQWYLMVEQTEAESVKNILNALIINLLICVAITGIVLALTSVTIGVYQDRLEKMATTDKLTGLLNRQALDPVLEMVSRSSRRRNSPLSAILFDVDGFKQINDRFGHLAGDAVLRGLAGLIRRVVRGSDAVCRWGGEEFLILLQDCDIEQAYTVAEKLRRLVAQETFQHERHSIQVTASMGVVQYVSGEAYDTMFSRADRALLTAKEGGRNRIEVARG